MARPRTPKAKAEITGAAKNHPGRFAARSEPTTAPLGEPSSWMVKNQVLAWQMFQRELPWLMESDRALVEVASVIRGRLISGEDVSIGALNCLRVCCGMLGGSPASRSKVSVEDPDTVDPLDVYFDPPRPN
jgi:hypothetical protein